VYLLFLIPIEHFQAFCQFFRSHRFSIADFFGRVLVNSPTHEFALGDIGDTDKLLVGRHGESFALVDD
jgi:hypothetical protein